jgi:hypothetical protein
VCGGGVCVFFRGVQESYVVSRIHYLIEHSTVRQTPCLPTCKGTASHVRNECTQFTSRHHLLYSILIPQHPVPLVSMNPNRSHHHPHHPRDSPVAPLSPHLEYCPFYSRKLFCFSIFFCRSVTHRSPDLPRCLKISTLQGGGWIFKGVGLFEHSREMILLQENEKK